MWCHQFIAKEGFSYGEIFGPGEHIFPHRKSPLVRWIPSLHLSLHVKKLSCGKIQTPEKLSHFSPRIQSLLKLEWTAFRCTNSLQHYRQSAYTSSFIIPLSRLFVHFDSSIDTHRNKIFKSYSRSCYTNTIRIPGLEKFFFQLKSGMHEICIAEKDTNILILSCPAEMSN